MNEDIIFKKYTKINIYCKKNVYTPSAHPLINVYNPIRNQSAIIYIVKVVFQIVIQIY